MADQDAGFCSQKLLDWVMEQGSEEQSGGDNSITQAKGTSGSVDTDDLLAKTAGELRRKKKGKKSR